MNRQARFFLFGLLFGFIGGALVTLAGVWWLGFATLWTGGSPARSVSSTPTPAPGSTPPPGVTGGPPRPSGVANDLILSFSEFYVNRLMSAFLPPDGPLDRNSKLAIEEGGVLLIDGRIRIIFGPVNLQVPARLRVGARAADGRLALSLDRVEVGPIPVPDRLIPETAKAALPQLEGRINSLLFESEATRGMRVVVVRTEKGRLVVELNGE